MIPPRAARRHPAGVTLIELIIALSILALATGAILGVVGIANRSSMLAQQFQNLQHNARTAVDRIVEEVRWGGAPRNTRGGFLEIGPTAFAVTVPADPEYPDCARPCRPYPETHPGRAYAVRYAFHPETQTIRRQTDANGRFEDQGWALGGWEPKDGVIIADHVSRVTFGYFDRNGTLTDAPAQAYRLSMRIEVRLGRYSRVLVSDAFLRQK